MLAIDADGHVPGARKNGLALGLLCLLLGLASLDLISPFADASRRVPCQTWGAAEAVGQTIATVEETGAVLGVTGKENRYKF